MKVLAFFLFFRSLSVCVSWNTVELRGFFEERVMLHCLKQSEASSQSLGF